MDMIHVPKRIMYSSHHSVKIPTNKLKLQKTTVLQTHLLSKKTH